MASPLLLAFGFGNPLLLWGLAAASLPILLHLLNRRRFRETRWAAMRFLLAAIRKNQRRIRIEQWLLLAVRTLLIILLVSALAQPFLESMGAVPLFAGQRTHRVLVLDGSMSMAYTSAERSQFDRAKEFADGYVKGARRGDAISVVLMADPPRAVIGAPSPNHDEVRRELEEIRLPHGSTDLPASFVKVNEVLASSDIAQKEVIFLTDLQANSWQASPGADEDLKRALQTLEERKVNSVIVDLGEDGGQNHAVTDLSIDAPIVALGASPPVISATLRNFGRTPMAGLRARLLIDGRLGPEQVVDLPPGEDVTVGFTYAFETAGDHVVEVRIDDDPLPLDNSRRLAVPVREVLRVLLVDGDYRPEPFEAETDYLVQALQPGEGSDESPALIAPEVIAEVNLSRRELSQYDVVVLCNIAQFTPVEVRALEGVLKQGGGLVLFGGDRVLAENYNQLLFADGEGLLPARLGPVVGEQDDRPDTAYEFDPLGFEHPIVSAYAGTPDLVLAGLTNVKTWRYHRLILPEDSTDRVALAFSDGSPAVIEAPRQRGTVFQIATTADAGWTSWPLHPSYPPVMEQIALRASSGRQTQRNVQVGQPLEQTLPPGGSEAPASVVAPDGRILATKVQPDGDASRLFFEGTDLSGIYRARLGPPIGQEIAFSANPDPAESDLTRLDAATLRAALPGWNFALRDSRGMLGEVDPGTVGRRGELHRPFLFAVLAMLFIESGLARWIGSRR
ncbi:BatA domain-containing protein [soil metagenome]